MIPEACAQENRFIPAIAPKARRRRVEVKDEEFLGGPDTTANPRAEASALLAMVDAGRMTEKEVVELVEIAPRVRAAMLASGSAGAVQYRDAVLREFARLAAWERGDLQTYLGGSSDQPSAPAPVRAVEERRSPNAEEAPLPAKEQARREKISAAARLAWADPVRKASRVARSRRMWADPERRQRIIAAMHSSDVAERNRAAQKKRWADPEARRRCSERVRAAHAVKFTPEMRSAAVRRSWAARRAREAAASLRPLPLVADEGGCASQNPVPQEELSFEPQCPPQVVRGEARPAEPTQHLPHALHAAPAPAHALAALPSATPAVGGGALPGRVYVEVSARAVARGEDVEGLPDQQQRLIPLLERVATD